MTIVPRCALPLPEGDCIRPKDHQGEHRTIIRARQPWTDPTYTVEQITTEDPPTPD